MSRSVSSLHHVVISLSPFQIGNVIYIWYFIDMGWSYFIMYSVHAQITLFLWLVWQLYQGIFLLLKYSPLFLSALSFHIRSTLHNSNTLQQYVFKLMASIPPVGLYQVHIRAKGLESPPIQNIVWCFGPYFTDSTLHWLQIPFQGTKIFPRELYRVPCPEILNCRNPWKLAEISSEKKVESDMLPVSFISMKKMICSASCKGPTI